MDHIVKEISSNIGKKITALREQRFMTLRELASEVGVCGLQLLKYEKGYNNITIGRLILIAKALKVPVSYFFSDVEGFSFKDKHTEQEKLCIELTNNFMKLKNLNHMNAVSFLVRSLAS